MIKSGRRNQGEYGCKMDKREFIEKLQRALAGGLNSDKVAENIRYYQDYIESEIQKGNTEEAVLSQLGDPRLLAKSIIEANKRAGASYGSNREYDEELTEYEAEEKVFNRKPRTGVMLPGWLIMIIVTVVVIVIIGLVTSLLFAFAPVIIVGLIALLIVKIVQSRNQS